MKCYLIDGMNNNKVVGLFETKKEAVAYVKAKRHTDPWRESYSKFKEYSDEFRVVSETEMRKSVHRYGKRMLSYYT